MKISVVIPTHRPNKASLNRVINACLNQDIDAQDFEILVVFNLVEDLERVKLPTFPPSVRVLCAGELGVNRARNWGAREARAPVVLFLDDDCAPALPSFLGRIIESLDSAPLEFVGIGGNYIDAGKSTWSVRGTNLMTRLWIQKGLLMETADLERVEKMRAVRLPVGNAHPARQLAGGNMAFRAEIFHKLGFAFDETIVSGGDETEFQRRLWKAGHQLLFSFERELAVIHEPSRRDRSAAISAIRRALRQGAISGKRTELRTAPRGHFLADFVDLTRALDRAQTWKDPAALAFVGLHFSSMFASRIFAAGAFKSARRPRLPQSQRH